MRGLWNRIADFLVPPTDAELALFEMEKRLIAAETDRINAETEKLKAEKYEIDLREKQKKEFKTVALVHCSGTRDGKPTVMTYTLRENGFGEREITRHFKFESGETIPLNDAVINAFNNSTLWRANILPWKEGVINLEDLVANDAVKLTLPGQKNRKEWLREMSSM